MKVIDNVALSYLLNDWCIEAGLNPLFVQYKVDHKRKQLHIYTSRPGLLIGAKGVLLEKYQDKLFELEIKYKCTKHCEIIFEETTIANFWVDYIIPDC